MEVDPATTPKTLRSRLNSTASEFKNKVLESVLTKIGALIPSGNPIVVGEEGSSDNNEGSTDETGKLKVCYSVLLFLNVCVLVFSGFIF